MDFFLQKDVEATEYLIDKISNKAPSKEEKINLSKHLEVLLNIPFKNMLDEKLAKNNNEVSTKKIKI